MVVLFFNDLGDLIPSQYAPFISTTDVASLLTPAADSLAPARPALTGLRLRRIPIAAFPSSNSLLVERRVPRWEIARYFR